MTDAQKIDRLREWLADMAKSKSKAHADGARFVLFDSGTLLDTLAGYLNGAPSAGAQDGDDSARAIGTAMGNGATWAVMATGYATPTKEPR